MHSSMQSTPPSRAGKSAAVDRSTLTVPSVNEIRAQFPALKRTHAGVPVAYFDGPGGTQVPRAVVNAVSDYLVGHNANTHWNYPTSGETDAILADARGALADFLGGEPEEIVFGANATTLAFHVSRTLGRVFSADDEIVITELDHHANVGPWQALAHERGCPLRVVRMNPEDGTLDWEDFERKVNSRTRLIAIGAASNALGTINDVTRACQLAGSVGAYAFVDAVHYAPHRLVDATGWDCDFVVCSAYKFYGPHVGAMWCRSELLGTLPFAKLVPAPDSAPDRAETGTLNHEGIAGAGAAVDFLASMAAGGTRRQQLQRALVALDERSAALTTQLWSGLAAIDGVTLYGPRPATERTSTVSFTVRGVASSEVARSLASRGLFLSHGNFYAATVTERLGLGEEGLVRAGCACYTTGEEIERLVEGVRKVLK